MSEDIEKDPLLRLWVLLYTKIHWTYSIAGTVTAKQSYTRETFEIRVPIYALKLQLTDFGTFRDT